MKMNQTRIQAEHSPHMETLDWGAVQGGGGDVM